MDPMTTTLSGTCLPKNAPQYSFARPHGTLSHWTFGSWFSKNKKARNKFSSEFSLKCLLFLCHCVSSFSWILLNSHCLSFSKRFGGLFQVKQDRDAAALRLQWFFMISGKKNRSSPWPKGLLVCWILSQQNISMPTKNLVSNVQPAVNLGASLFLDRKINARFYVYTVLVVPQKSPKTHMFRSRCSKRTCFSYE